MGVPNTSIQQKMQIDGFTEKDINTFLNPPLGATITTTTLNTAPKPTTTFDTSLPGAMSAAGAGVAVAGAVGVAGGGKYDKYRKMLSMNIPEVAVRRKIAQVHSVVYDIVYSIVYEYSV